MNDKQLTGLERIQLERARQISQKGWTHAHDDTHSDGSLWSAGICYEHVADAQVKFPTIPIEITAAYRLTPENWPWEYLWFKPSETATRTYEKAGALLSAEAERVDRLPDPNLLSARRIEARAAVVRIAAKIDALSPKSSKSR